jgi:hypothetical protein
MIFMKSYFVPGLIFLLIFHTTLAAGPDHKTTIFPAPAKLILQTSAFTFTENTRILLPLKASRQDSFLARLLISDLTDKHSQSLKWQTVSDVPRQGNYILLGTKENPLVRKYLLHSQVANKIEQRDESYVVEINDKSIAVVGYDAAGAFYGLQSLRQLLRTEGQGVQVPVGFIQDFPRMPFRGIRMYVPGREQLPFFRKFIRDFMALYKFNRLILEMNANMRLYRHPELNIGSVQLAKELIYSRRDRPAGPHQEFQDSAHQDAADGGILEQEEVAELVAYARRHFIDVIPELPSLTHSYYLLSRHRDLAEIQNAEWPDSYCPSEPRSYALYFEVLDEYIQVMKPHMIHIGHDEWRMPVHECARCAGKEYSELFAADVNRIYKYLAGKKILVAMWGDHLVPSVRGKGLQKRESASGHRYLIPGALAMDLVQKKIPKDILVLNWFWGDSANDGYLSRLGFKQIYGNFRPNISNWQKRSQRSGMLGGAPSSWAGTTELNFGKDLLYDYLGCAQLLWSSQPLSFVELGAITRSLMPKIQRNLSGKILPSDDDQTTESVDLSSWYNVTAKTNILGTTLGELDFKSAKTNPTRAAAIITGTGNRNSLPHERVQLPINADVSSLVFWHACVQSAGNEPAYSLIHNFDDTADLLGWYEVVYEDGLQTTIPIRYGINILDCEAGRRKEDTWEQGNTGFPQTVYAYLASSIEVSKDAEQSKLFYRFEWRNPRFGKAIKNVNLQASDRFQAPDGKVMEENAIILLAIDMIRANNGNPPSLKSGS